MREHLKILNSKEIKVIVNELREHFSSDFVPDYVFLENNKEKIYILSRDYGNIDESKLRVNNLGLYFCTREKDGFRLSIEGCQLTNPKKNFYNATKEEAAQWISGESIKAQKADELSGYVIVKYGEDFIGCGKYRDGEILNAVPKDRRILKLSE